MGQAMVFTLNNQSVRFTPDGKVSVVDAIRIVTNSNSPGAIWDTIKAEHPEVLMHCEDYSFKLKDLFQWLTVKAGRRSGCYYPTTCWT